MDRMVKDERKMDHEMEDLLKMDARKPVVDRVLTTMESFEPYVHKNQLVSILRPEGRWKPVRTRSVANSLVQSIYPFSFRDRVQTSLKWSEKDETDPEQAWRTVLGLLR